MGLSKPYRRTCRQFVDGTYANGGQSAYINDGEYAVNPGKYTRPFFIIQKDLQNLFDFIEPSDINSICYSYRIHELFLRTCIEIEANCKAILRENGYLRKGNWNICDYKKIEFSHKLSSYEVEVPDWEGLKNIRRPNLAWEGSNQDSDKCALPWYRAYNSVKHDRQEDFHQANLDNLIDAVCALMAILAAQFYTVDFQSSISYRVVAGPDDGFETAIGKYFRVKFPEWNESDQYGFKIADWQNLNISEQYEYFPYGQYSSSLILS